MNALIRRIADLRAALEVIAVSGCSAEDARYQARLALADDDRAAASERDADGGAS